MRMNLDKDKEGVREQPADSEANDERHANQKRCTTPRLSLLYTDNREYSSRACPCHNRTCIFEPLT